MTEILDRLYELIDVVVLNEQIEDYLLKKYNHHPRNIIVGVTIDPMVITYTDVESGRDFILRMDADSFLYDIGSTQIPGSEVLSIKYTCDSDEYIIMRVQIPFKN